ncbi:hypothetical protein ACTMSW_01890 [Micromonospora sp. BQ11]|uniref:hypothetical protein n=1 Tax=Micromonospora sp. BQ11 TaxID=3452212 RepID=UPI003F8AFC91
MLRRHAARLAAICALVAGSVTLGASPALADDDSVRVRAAGSYTAGGSPEGVALEVRKRSDGCVLLRTALSLRLDGLRADQVTVQVNDGGRWSPVPLSDTGGGVATAATAPSDPRLCKDKSVTVRYRLAFAASAPGGRLIVAGEAAGARGQLLGRGNDTSRVEGADATATPTPSKKPSPTPSAVATVPVTVDEDTPVAALAQPAGDATRNVAQESSGPSPILFFGLAMVAVGLVLIVLLVRRFREDRAQTKGRRSGGTFGAGRGPAGPVQPGVYGQQQPPAQPGVYGARPTGGVYGARPAAPAEATQVMPRPGAGTPSPTTYGTPPAAPTSAPPVPGRYGTPVSAPPASGRPPVPGQYGAPVSSPPATDQPPADPGAGPSPSEPPASTGDGDHTVFMPRLPG